MLKRLICLFLVVFSFSGLFGDLVYVDPFSTPPGTTIPDLSTPGGNSVFPRIVTDSRGRNVYAIWSRSGGSSGVQTARSNSFGNSWIYPSSTPIGTSSPNISLATGQEPWITTNSTGQYVYAIWILGGVNETQVVRSRDFGDSWIIPNSTPPGTISPSITVPLSNTIEPSITTDGSGANVYAIWGGIGSGGDDAVQVAISNNFGDSWIYPNTAALGTITPDLSVAGGDAEEGTIATDNSGRFVYASWRRSNGNVLVQVARSVDSGNTWINPSSTPSGFPNISPLGGDTQAPKITTNYTGQYVYVIWQRNNGANEIIQTARSIDFGDTWIYPTSTPAGTTAPPDLSRPLEDAGVARITTDRSGKYVYATWERNDGPNRVVQTARSTDYGDTWSYPISTLPGSISPDLSDSSKDASNPSITTDGIQGRYVYASWAIDEGATRLIQTAFSDDFGTTWQIPFATVFDTPNITQEGSSSTPLLITDATGKFVYIIWSNNQGAPGDFVQVAIGIIPGFPASFQMLR